MTPTDAAMIERVQAEIARYERKLGKTAPDHPDANYLRMKVDNLKRSVAEIATGSSKREQALKGKG